MISFALTYIYCILIFLKSDKGSLARLLSVIFLASLTGFMLLFDFGQTEMIDIVYSIWICVVVGAIVLPWKSFKNITTISEGNCKNVDRLGTILIIICILLSISCAILAYFVMTMVTDINKFKYVDGASDFYYSLGIDMHGFILTTILYPIGYLLVPYVFYYLSNGRKFKAFLSFLGSMLPVFYGLTYFSRSHMTHFVMIYIAAFYLLHDVLSATVQRRIKVLMLAVGIGAAVGFFAISISRFEDHEYNTGNREISTKNQSSTFVSTIDYLSQWWPIGQEMFRRFNGATMNNSIILQSTESFFYTLSFGVLPSHALERMKRREKLFGEYSGAFIGVGSYILYDQGPIFGIVLLWLYFVLVKKQKPSGSVLDMKKMLMVFTLIQIPLFAIFYSVFDLVLLTLILLIPINLYLKKKS